MKLINMKLCFLYFIIFIFLFLLIRYKKCSIQNIREAFLNQMPEIPNKSGIGCNGSHGNGVDNHHHGSCGVETCGKGKFLKTENGFKTCEDCPANTYKNKNTHTDSSCDSCGTHATSPSGSASCTCTTLHADHRVWDYINKCSASANCAPGYPYTKASQDEQIREKALIGSDDINGDNDTYNFTNPIYNDNCWSADEVRRACNNTANFQMRESNGDFYCAYHCSYLKGKGGGIGSADSYECGRDGRSAHQAYCEMGANGCRGRR